MPFLRRARLFRKYGKHFEIEEPEPNSAPPEPESPYEPLSYQPPEKRGPTPVQREELELEELRPGVKSHWD